MLIKSTTHDLHNTAKHTDTVREQVVNVVEHLAAEEPGVSLRSWWRPNTELKELM